MHGYGRASSSLGLRTALLLDVQLHVLEAHADRGALHLRVEGAERLVLRATVRGSGASMRANVAFTMCAFAGIGTCAAASPWHPPCVRSQGSAHAQSGTCAARQLARGALH